jgi:DNA-binding PadR family transcriptional regulator
MEVRPMAKRRKVGNLMALAVLSVLAHRPMHPYEMAGALRGWGKDRDMGVKWGSLYSVVQRLADHGFIEEAGTFREGNRPERTIYQITKAGRDELVDWARELLANPEVEPSRFRAGLSVMVALPPGEVAGLLRDRLTVLQEQAAALRETLETHRDVPRLFLAEEEYDLAMIEAETRWARGLLDEIESGSFPGLGQWRDFHDSGTLPEEMKDLAEKNIENGDR